MYLSYRCDVLKNTLLIYSIPNLKMTLKKCYGHIILVCKTWIILLTLKLVNVNTVHPLYLITNTYKDHLVFLSFPKWHYVFVISPTVWSNHPLFLYYVLNEKLFRKLKRNLLFHDVQVFSIMSCHWNASSENLILSLVSKTHTKSWGDV